MNRFAAVFVAWFLTVQLSGRALAQDRPLPAEALPFAELYAKADDLGALAGCDGWLAAHEKAEPLSRAAVVAIRARALLALGRFDEARAAAESLPQPVASERLLLAECLAHSKDGATAAFALVDAVAQSAPTAIAPQLARGRIALALGRGRDASAALEGLRLVGPDGDEARLLAARIAELSGKAADAEKLYGELAGDPGTGSGVPDLRVARDAVMGLAGLLVRQRRYDEAIEKLVALVARIPTFASGHAQLGVLQGLREHYAESIASWRRAVELVPDSVEYRFRLGDLYRSQGETLAAIEQFEKVKELGHLPAIAALRLGELYLDQGDVATASGHIETLAKLAPDSADAAELEGRLREKQKDRPAAIACYRKVMAKNPLAFDALYRLALLLARSGDPAERAESESLLARHQKVEPHLHELERSKQEFDLNPRNGVVATRMAAFLNLAGETATARIWAERADALDPNSGSNAVQMGYILANQGDAKSARAWFSKAITLIGAAPQGKAAADKLREYVRTIDAGEPLPLPLGELARPGVKPAEGSAPASGGK